jgi:hypothetical protein
MKLLFAPDAYEKAAGDDLVIMMFASKTVSVMRKPKPEIKGGAGSTSVPLSIITIVVARATASGARELPMAHTPIPGLRGLTSL